MSHQSAEIQKYITPPSLQRGDGVAILSPASVVNPEYIDKAAERIAAQGFNPIIMPSAKGPSHGTYASSIEKRLEDMTACLKNPEIKAILCARGGYGAVHLLPNIPLSLIADNPKWLIGFSDISALHALWHTAGVKSLHSPMAKHLAENSADNHISELLFSILRGEKQWSDTVATDSDSFPGQATGILRGGNLAVLNGLAATPFDMFKEENAHHTILFLEDIAEPIYKIERVLYRLHLSGFLDNVKGFIFGHFTEYNPSANYSAMEQMILERLEDWKLTDRPVALRFPVGHVNDNRIMAEGANCTLSVTEETTTLIQRL